MAEPPLVIEQRREQQRLISSGIGARVSQLRRNRGLRVADLAAAVGVSPSLISQIERGRSAPSVATLFMLAKALAVPVDDLFEEMSPSASPPPRRRPLGEHRANAAQGGARPAGRSRSDAIWSARTTGLPSTSGAG